MDEWMHQIGERGGGTTVGPTSTSNLPAISESLDFNLPMEVNDDLLTVLSQR